MASPSVGVCDPIAAACKENGPACLVLSCACSRVLQQLTHLNAQNGLLHLQSFRRLLKHSAQAYNDPTLSHKSKVLPCSGGEAAAAINWVLKDGAGRLGKFLFGRWCALIASSRLLLTETRQSPVCPAKLREQLHLVQQVLCTHTASSLFSDYKLLRYYKGSILC